jgi:hypothetical protein
MKKSKKTKKYVHLKKPRHPVKGGLFALKDAAGKTLHKKCLICKEAIKSDGNFPAIVCAKKKCFRAYRNAYRRDYDRQAA